MYCGRGDGSDFSVEVDQVTLEPKPDTMSLNNMLRYETQNTRVFSPPIISQGPRKHSVQRQLWQPVELQARVWRRKRLAHSSGEHWDLSIGFLLVNGLSHPSVLVNGPSQSSHYWSIDFLNPPTSQIVNCPIIRGDTRVLFQSSSDQVFFKFFETVISSPTNGIFGKLWIRTSCFVILFGKTCWVTNGL